MCFREIITVLSWLTAAHHDTLLRFSRSAGHHHHHQNYLPVIKSCQNATYTIKRNRAPSIISSADIRRDLHWLPINYRISYKISLLTWKALYTAEPSYLSELISPYVLARVVVQAPSAISSGDIRRDLHWLRINHRISYKPSLLTWKALYTAEPSYLSELISPYVSTRTLRSSNTYLLSIPTGVTSHFFSRFFCFRTVNLELFTSTCSLYRRLSTFKRQLKSHFLWRRDVVVTALVVQRSYSTSSPVSTGMGDVSGFNSRRRHFISVCNQPRRSTQPFILSRSINE